MHVFDAAAPARAGHYQPQTYTLAEIEAHSASHGIGHLVLVQPSVYGTDNSVMLRALRQAQGRHRGVAVVDASVSDTALDDMHAAGVRGVRFNTISPVGNGEEALHALAPRLHERGWHVQWYVTPAQLPHLVSLQRQTGLTFVLDHLAGFSLDRSDTAEAWQALQALGQQGAWLKLSGWYRLGCSEPYEAMTPLIRQASASFADRLVWGSDWPHTSLPAQAASRHASLLAPVQQALGEAALQSALCMQPPRLYDLA